MRPLSIALLSTILFCFPEYLYSQEVWGTAIGPGHGGAIFNTQANLANQSTQYEFRLDYIGAYPKGNLLETSPGHFYGLAYLGGNSGGGVLFEYNYKTGVYTNKFDFEGQIFGQGPTGSLVMANNGKLYGMTTYGGVNGLGTLFEYDISSNSLTKKVDFDGLETGATPYGKLTLAANGKLYGTTSAGGLHNGGVIFEFNPTDGVFSKKINLSSTTGSSPVGSLCRALNGRLYGVCRTGGYNNAGTIFSYNSYDGTLEKSFDLLAGMSVSIGGLTEVLFGRFYFVMNVENATDMNGALFEYNDNIKRLEKKVNFSTSDGTHDYSDLTLRNNVLFGSASRGGVNARGTIFSYDPLYETFKKICDFENEQKGMYPSDGGLTVGADGNLYGMTNDGGTSLRGTLYRIDQFDNSFTKLFNFWEALNGAFPLGSLLMASDGKFYSTTTNGGSYGRGVLFQYDPHTKKLEKKIDFDGLNGDNTPAAQKLSLMQASNGKLYGMTARGGLHNRGVLFEYDLVNDIYIKKIDFDSQDQPAGKLVEVTQGKLYGMTLFSGASGAGSIFSFDFLSNTYTTEFEMTVAGGHTPRGSLTKAFNGKLYGLTVSGGVNAHGVLFEFDPSTNIYSVKHNFHDATGGANPYGSLTETTDGKLYGTTYNGGVNQNGTLFEFDLMTGDFKTKVQFDPLTTGSKSTSDITLSTNGKLYGMTSYGGLNNYGTLFEYDIASSSVTTVSNFTRNSYVQSLVSVPIKLYQDITFSAIPEKTYGDLPFNITEASISSGLPLLYASSDTTIVKVTGTTITIKKAGACWISAYHGGDNSYYATSAKQLLVVKKATPVVRWDNHSPISYGTKLTTSQLNASSTVSGTYIYDPPLNSMLDAGENQMLYVDFVPDDAVNYTSLEKISTYINVTKAPLTIRADDKTRPYHSGSPLFTLSYSGFINDDNLNSISPPYPSTTTGFQSAVGHYPIYLYGGSSKNYEFIFIYGTLTIEKATQTISFDSIQTQQLGSSPFVLNARSTSNLPILFSTENQNKVTLDNDIVIVHQEPGSVTIRATQEGSSNYEPAFAERTFCITPRRPMITPLPSDFNKVILQCDSPFGNEWFLNDIIIDTTRILAIENEGTYRVRVTIDNCTSDFQSIFIRFIDVSHGASIIPNPVNDYLNIFGLPNTKISANAIDATGKTQAIELMNWRGYFSSPAQHLAPGAYILRVDYDNSTLYLRFLKM